MALTLNLLLTILLELPIAGFFFKRRKRRTAYLVCLFVNLVTWPLVHIIRLKTNWDLNVVMIAAAVLEMLGYWFILNCGWKKALLIALICNVISYAGSKFVPIEQDQLPKKIEIIR